VLGHNVLDDKVQEEVVRLEGGTEEDVQRERAPKVRARPVYRLPTAGKFLSMTAVLAGQRGGSDVLIAQIHQAPRVVMMKMKAARAGLERDVLGVEEFLGE
jgi:hypothetical protein